MLDKRSDFAWLDVRFRRVKNREPLGNVGEEAAPLPWIGKNTACRDEGSSSTTPARSISTPHCASASLGSRSSS